MLMVFAIFVNSTKFSGCWRMWGAQQNKKNWKPRAVSVHWCILRKSTAS